MSNLWSTHVELDYRIINIDDADNSHGDCTGRAVGLLRVRRPVLVDTDQGLAPSGEYEELEAELMGHEVSALSAIIDMIHLRGLREGEDSFFALRRSTTGAA